jgi:hypothetical protein
MCQYFGLDAMDIQVESENEIGKTRIHHLKRKSFCRCWCRAGVLLCLAANVIAIFGQAQRPIIIRSSGAPAQIQTQNQNIVPLSLRMQIKDGRVNAAVRSAPLQRVLEELAARSGVVFQVQSQDNPLVSITLQEVSLQEAIQRIASADDLIFYHGRDSSGQSAMQLVKVYPRADVPLQPSIRYIGSGVITKTGENSEENP